MLMLKFQSSPRIEVVVAEWIKTDFIVMNEEIQKVISSLSIIEVVNAPGLSALYCRHDGAIICILHITQI